MDKVVNKAKFLSHRAYILLIKEKKQAEIFHREW
jgi:hypothetical protein